MLRNTFFAVSTVLALATSSLAAVPEGMAGDSKTSVAYDSATGNFALQPDGNPIGLFDIKSASGIFTGNATLPPGGLGLDVNAANRKSWAALPAAAVSAVFDLGNIAAPGLTKAFLLDDLTIQVSGGFGTANVDGDLVYVGGGTVGVAPVVVDANLGNRIRGNQVSYQFTTSAGDPVPTWGSLTPVAGNPVPSVIPSLSAAGLFTWDSNNSPFGAYSWDVTATNSAGNDVGRLTVNIVVPEPATISMIGLALVGLVGAFRRRR